MSVAEIVCSIFLCVIAIILLYCFILMLIHGTYEWLVDIKKLKKKLKGR